MLGNTETLSSPVLQPLACQGGPMTVPDWQSHEELFHWPHVTDEDIEAVVGIMRERRFSLTDESKIY